VAIYTGCAVVCVSIILVRRYVKFFGGELGGPAGPRYASGAFVAFLWILYVLLSSLQAYNKIPGF